jgi:hypothetical protein
VSSTPPVVKLAIKGGTVIVDAQDAHLLSEYHWYVNNGYVRSNSHGHRGRLLHRLITQAPAGMIVDHINGDPLDNRRANLRVCTHAENLRNSHSRWGKTSRWKGVCWRKRSKKWVAQMSAGPAKGMLHLGYFDCELCAARAYRDAALSRYGEFANFDPVPDCEHVS